MMEAVILLNRQLFVLFELIYVCQFVIRSVTINVAKCPS